MKKKNISQISKEYIYGYLDNAGHRSFPTLEELISKYKLASATVFRASSKENWAIQRKDYLKQLRDLTENSILMSESNALKDLAETSFVIAFEILKLIECKLESDLTPSQLQQLANAELKAQQMRMDLKEILQQNIQIRRDPEDIKNLFEQIKNIY